VNSQEVAQYFSKMVNEINQKVRTDTGQRPKNRNIDSIYIIIGLISILVIGGLVLLKKRPNKKSKK